MIYDLDNPKDREDFKFKVEKVIEKGQRVDLTVKYPRRSLSQNAYEHLLFSWFAIEYGERKEYVKQVIFKQWVNEDIFKTTYINPKTGEERQDWRSTADLDKMEKILAIDRFRDYASKEAGIYLPTSTDLALLDQIEKEVSKPQNKLYL